MIRYGTPITVISEISNQIRRLESPEIVESELKLLHKIEKNFLPSGSGIDTGTKIDIEHSTPEKIIMYCAFHHMTEYGMYDGWTDHRIKITPLFNGLDIHVTGRNRNQIKEYLAETYNYVLTQKIIRTFDTETECSGYITMHEFERRDLERRKD